mmetsp:Transcript_9943/g.17068  ORF Transcript_9943/g.17068 Transcript_9943/m.17068 type:complete len:152 (-) Transcript_9943:534-989(-)
MFAATLRRVGTQVVRTAISAAAPRAPVVEAASRPVAIRAFHNTSFAASSAPTKVKAEDIEHATGLELAELEALVEGKDLFLDGDVKWLDAPFGTEANPVVVTSMFEERIVGATDPDDDSIVCWGIVRLGKPPVMIGAEYFVLKQIEGAGHH